MASGLSTKVRPARGGFENKSNLGLTVRGRDKGCLVLAWRQPDSSVEHGTMEAPEGNRIRSCRTGEVGHRLISEEPREHGTDAVDRHGDAGFVRNSPDAFRDDSCCLFQSGIDVLFMRNEVTQRRNSGSHG